ncbi:MAG: beta-propeller domain-containing protein [Clostridiales bacterium]|nr:beta-propeller domain-containing protein [Clostridiales bacterium]
MKKRINYFLIIALVAALAIPFAYGSANTGKEAEGNSARDAGGKLDNAVAMYINSGSAIVNDKDVPIDVSDLTAAPLIREGRTFIPLRFVSESLGATVSWDSRTKTAQIASGANKAEFTIGEKFLKMNGKQVDMDVSTLLINGRTFVPVRALAENVLGKEVFWHKNLIIISGIKDIFDPAKDMAEISGIVARVNQIPVVGTKERLAEIIKERAPKYDEEYYVFGESVERIAMDDAAPPVDAGGATPIFSTSSEPQMNAPLLPRTDTDTQADAPEAPMLAPAADMAVAEEAETAGEAGGGGGASSDYSATNVQVAGVDEGDIVKTDGKYIYQVNYEKIVVIQAYPAENMKIVSEIEYNRNDMLNSALSPAEVYVDGDRLVVIGNMWSDKSYAKAIVYDIADKSNIKQIREVALEGSYLSSRKIGDCVYMVSNKYMDYYIYTRGGALAVDEAIPMYKDSAAEDKYVRIGLADMHYFPSDNDTSHTFIAGFKIDDPSEPADITSYLGSGQHIYCSRENLYIAKPVYNYSRYSGVETTEIYKFNLNGGKVAFEIKGAVRGQPLNQFSMDEYAGHFRIAVTENSYAESDMLNHLYVLSADTLETVGKIEGMARGERIYSVRFMGAKGYMVTFRLVDPLFAIDLSDPARPEVLGELKIPGFSQYLHPYDDNHIIGFGKDTEVVRENWNGHVSERVLEVGMKMALFDVTDPTSPKEMYSTKIGDRGTFSEVLDNHRALLFSKEKDIIAFPVMVYKQSGNAFDYGRPTFQGAIVYGLDIDRGFTMKGKISHTDAQSDGYWDYMNAVDRILYIDDVLYTSSKAMVKASEMNSLREIKSVSIKTNEKYWPMIEMVE